MTIPTVHDAGVLDALREIVDSATAGKVFGAPIMQEDAIIVPVAAVGGGGGGGTGTGPAEEGREAAGMGGGFGMSAKPLGVFVLKNGKVRWHPAIDINKVVMGGQIVAVMSLLVLRALIKSRTAGGVRHSTSSERAGRLVRQLRARF